MASDVSPPAPIDNPWLRAFLADPWQEITIGQVLIRRVQNDFELCHVDDTTALKAIRPTEARALANFTVDKKFRPLKSTPDLPTGWLLRANTLEELETALQSFYPNALADSFALRQNPPPITDYRTFTNRQTGMYRITTFLDDAGVTQLTQSVCQAACLKRRLWPIGPIRHIGPISPIPPLPCLEPCAIFLEAARKKVRSIQADSAPSSN